MVRFVMARRSIGLVLLLAAFGCGGTTDQVTVEFATLSALEHTNLLSITAFEPFIRDPESESLEFVRCQDISPFPPVQRVNPETIAVSNLVGKVLTDRENETYPLDGDWSLSFDRPDPESDSNPWGAMMVYIEARGDARASDRGAGQVSATLLSGCYCVRTRDEGFSDPALSELDKEVRRECPLLDDPDAPVDERVVALEALTPPEFHLKAESGGQNLATPKNGPLTPGPQLLVDEDRCDNVVTPVDCFRCATPSCPELDDKSNVPILVTIEQPGGDASPRSQVVLTDSEGKASASIQIDDCRVPISITTQIVGRPEESVSFDVDCIDSVPGFECIDETSLAPGFEAVAVATVPGEAGPCSSANPGACDHVAVLYDNGTDSKLQVRSPITGVNVELDFPGLRAHAVEGFHYEPGSGASPAVAVVLADASLNARVYVYRWQGAQLVPHDGVDGLLTGRCGWFESCQSNAACTNDADCNPTMTITHRCEDDRCRLLECWPRLQLQSRVTISARDLDFDGRQDLAIGNSGEHPIVFFRTTETSTGAMYASDGCICGRFGQAPNAFALANMGGASPNPDVGDVVLGASGGTFLMYSVASSEGPQLACGQAAPLGDGMSARDVKAATLSCRPDDLSCAAYDDAVIVSARGISGGSLDEPGFIRVLYGSSTDLSVGGNALDGHPELSLGLVPRAFPDRGEPRDPRNAQIADFNSDGHQDLAVLYKASEEVHVWLGASNRTLGELEQGVVLEDCPVSLQPGTRCAPLPSFAAPDLDGDGFAEVAVVCDPMGATPRLRFFRAQAN